MTRPLGPNRLLIAAFALGALLLGAPAANAATITPNTLADQFNTGAECSLREAVQAANTNGAFGGCPAGSGADTIPLATGTYAITITGSENANLSGDLDVIAGSDVTISHTGITPAAIDGGGVGRVLHVVAATSTATVSGVTIRNGNSVPDTNGGGGIRNGGTVNVTDATLSENVSVTTGGALTNAGGAGIATLTNVTISGNRALGDGGGINTEAGTINLNGVTITGNTADMVGGGVRRFVGTINTRNTIIAGNIDTGGETPDCGGTITSQGNNLIGNTTGCTFTAVGGDKVIANPLLGSLADNGGSTFTHALSAGSQAIGGAGATAAPFDQRGVPRTAPDIGAYELVTCGEVIVNRLGTAGDDTLNGTAGADGFLSLAGKDVLAGLGGADALCGGDGKDTLKGGAGKDLLRGENGKDKLKGGKGKDKLIGGTGADKLSGGGGNDSCKGGKGKDDLTSC